MTRRVVLSWRWTRNGHRLAHPAFVLVVTLDQRDGLSGAAVSADDRCDDGE
jgi:hypothetical protein